MANLFEANYQQGLAHAAAGRHDLAIVAFEQALKDAPEDIRIIFALARTADALDMAAVAKKLYRKALIAAPDRTEVLVALTNLLRREGNYAAAEGLLAPGLKHKNVPAEIWLSYGSLKRECGEDRAAESCYRKALELRPDYIPALGNLADMLSDAGQFDAALRLYYKLLDLAPDHHQARFSRGLIHLIMGNTEAGWQDYEARKRLPDAPRTNHGLPEWDGQFFSGQRLMIAAEQGIGDQVMFAALIPQLLRDAKAAGAEMTIACEPRLSTLFTRSFPGAKILPVPTSRHMGKNYLDYAGLTDLGGADCQIGMGSLPGYFHLCGNSPQPGPFLVPDAEALRKWRAWLSTRPRPWIGLCWRSGKAGGLRSRQYASPEAWGEAMRDMPGSLISVQYDAHASEYLGLETISGRKLEVPPRIDQKQEIDRSCALLAALDLVISAPTAVAWQAAGVGTNVARILEVPGWTQLGTDHESFSVCATPCICSEENAGRDRIKNWSTAFARAQSLLQKIAA